MGLSTPTSSPTTAMSGPFTDIQRVQTDIRSTPLPANGRDLMNAEVKGLVWSLAAMTFIAVSVFSGIVFLAAIAFR